MQLPLKIPALDTSIKPLLILAGLFSILCFIGAAIYDNLFLLVVPIGLVFVVLFLTNYRWIYLLLFAAIPLSTEVELPNGFGTDLPTEPLMLALMVAAILVLLRKNHLISSKVILHPLSLLLLLHYGWLWFASISSENIFVSVKFCLAKTWYILGFYFLSIIILRNLKFHRTVLSLTGISLITATAIIVFRHSTTGFAFEDINTFVGPFFRNHVNSSATMSVFAPFVVYLILTSKRVLVRMFWVAGLIILLAGIYFSYTRAAHICFFLAILSAFIFYRRWMRYAVGIALVAGVVIISNLISDNRYMDYAPEFETTVSHNKFGDLVSATYKGKDISTMERVYRWVAGYQMVQERPWLGFGPGNFYNFYKSYTLTNFRTYVSDNPEKSGIHSYYFMTVVEQGLLGLIIFLILCIYVVLKFEEVIGRVQDRDLKLLITCAACSFIVILAFQLINDLVETDKVGSFFFLNLALLLLVDLRTQGIDVVKESNQIQSPDL